MAVLDLIPEIELTFSQQGNTSGLSIKPQYKFDSPCLSFVVFVDGARALAILVQSSKHGGLFYSHCVKGVRTTDKLGNPTVKPFKFSRITATSDERNRLAIDEETKTMSRIGEITVEVHRKAEARPKQSRSKGKLLSTPAEVHERALKGDAKSHGVSLGPEQRAHEYNNYWCAYLDDKNFPMATYKFKYRSKDALKQLLITERSPDPNATQNSSALDDLDPEQRREAERYIEQLKRGKGIKREHDGGDSASRKKLCKPEEEIMTVDLTGDD